MGKKRIICELNNDDNSLSNVGFDHHHHHHHHHHDHHHHHRHHHEKKNKIKPEAKLLHTLNSHFKKLAKSRSRNPLIISSSSSPPPIPKSNSAAVFHETRDKDHHHDYPRTPCMAMHGSNSQSSTSSSSSLKREHFNDWIFDVDSDEVRYKDVHGGHEYDGGDTGVFDFRQEICCVTASFLEWDQENEDLFGGHCSFAPDLNASHDLLVRLEEEEEKYGPGSGWHIPDPVVKMDYNDDDDEAKNLSEILELSSQEDMINEFLKVDLFFS